MTVQSKFGKSLSPEMPQAQVIMFVALPRAALAIVQSDLEY